jgi:hypothetical protein
MSHRRIIIAITALLLLIPRSTTAEPDDDDNAPASSLPAQTSKYNKGNLLGRYRDKNHKVIFFNLKQPEVPIYDGGGREIGKVKKPVMLNSGAAKTMSIDGKSPQSFAWAWATGAGSGWIARSSLVNPPKPDIDPNRDPKPPHDSDQVLTIDAAAGREKLKGLRHINSKGIIPPAGNQGTDYAGRHPGDHDYVYLLFAVPNVIRGGMARDSLIDGSKFIPAMDEHKNPIIEVMTMYEDADMKKPKKVSFLYGRAETGNLYGWVARANVGDL